MSSDKYIIQSESLLSAELDIICIAETHLRDNLTPELNGYSVVVHNREHLHRRARSGSGGVCIFIKECISNMYNVSVLDDTIEDILWVKLVHCDTSKQINICVCYLSPEGSSRHVDPHDYFTNLLNQLYVYGDNGPFIICGDFNSRCGDEQDFIVGVDDIPLRECIDFKRNSHGDLLLDFLINSNCIMMNGRCKGLNDFTSVSTKGLAVVDYAIVGHEFLSQCDNFHVLRAQDAFIQSNLLGRCDPQHNISDHSLIYWDVKFNSEQSYSATNNDFEQGMSITKYDVSNIPEDFMSQTDCVSNMRAITDYCSDSNMISGSYEQFCKELDRCMTTALPSKRITLGGSRKAHRRHTLKPWWSQILSDSWHIRCTSQARFCKCIDADKKQCRLKYLSDQREFDKLVKTAKRHYWHEEQQRLLTIHNTGEFWKTIGSVGARGAKTKSQIPWEIVDVNGNICDSHTDILEHWKSSFESLLNNQSEDSLNLCDLPDPPVSNIDTTPLNTWITVEEIRYALVKAGKGKALGNDRVPMEVLNNNTCVLYLSKLFNTCFDTGVVPSAWLYGIITPIPKNIKDDPREPLNYRGITVTSSVYKLYCSILYNRLMLWVESNVLLRDEQNGFRPGRSTIDHVGSVTNIVETRIKKKQNTYAAMIDFSKAYDKIDRELLWYKLKCMGISQKMICSLKSLYANVKCSIKINGLLSDWFDVKVGLKQGCIISPILFNLYLNDLMVAINGLNCGVCYGDDSLSILAYADDIVLLAESENNLQAMLHTLEGWCKQWGLTINMDKSKIVHFRSKSMPLSNYEFSCNSKSMEIVPQYKYLGLVLTEHLDYSHMAKLVAQSASRALGFLICKDKTLGGMPFNCYTKCYSSLVQSVFDYGSSIWGTNSYSCVEAVQNRACRYFLGLGKYAPNPAINGDMGWASPQHKQWVSVIRRWLRLMSLDDSLLTKKIFISCRVQANRSCRTWCDRVSQFLIEIDHTYVNDGLISVRSTIASINETLNVINEKQWHDKLNAQFAIRGEAYGGNKLRTYRKFKHKYVTEQYVMTITQKKYRSAYAKFRCGVAPIKIELGRYGVGRVPVDERLCRTCNIVEDEFHVIMICPQYTDIRSMCMERICNIKRNFEELSTEDQFIETLSNPLYYKIVAKALHSILAKRRHAEYL